MGLTTRKKKCGRRNVEAVAWESVLSYDFSITFLTCPYPCQALGVLTAEGHDDHSGGCHHTPSSLTTSSPHLSAVAQIKSVRYIFRITSSFVSSIMLHKTYVAVESENVLFTLTLRRLLTGSPMFSRQVHLLCIFLFRQV